MPDLRRAFFDHIRDQRELLEAGEYKVLAPDLLDEFLHTVGNFLFNEGVITVEDWELAVGLIEDYEDLFRARFGGARAGVRRRRAGRGRGSR